MILKPQDFRLGYVARLLWREAAAALKTLPVARIPSLPVRIIGRAPAAGVRPNAAGKQLRSVAMDAP